MAYNNYSISKKKGKFYLKEKTPTQGYEEVIYGPNKDKKTYHQYHNKVEGTPKYFGHKEVTFDGRTLKFIELSLEKDGDTNKISANLNNKNGFSDEAKALISAMDGYKLGEPVSVTVNVKKSEGKNGKVYENLNLYINYDNIKNEQGKGQSTGYISYEDIPSPIKGDDGMGGVTWDWTPVNKFYYQKLQEIEKRFEGNTSAPSTQTETKPQVKQEPVTVDLDEYSDLPF